jgi:RNA polymerase sigma-70 factor (ECF subfamily)
LKEQEFIKGIDNCKGLILKLIGLYAYSFSDRNDIYQEILFNAWRGIKSFQGKSKFSTWLYQVALNTIFTYNRTSKKTMGKISEIEDLIVPVAPQVEKREDIQRLYQAIRKLSEIDRIIITLNLEGYENPEIADILGISPNYVGVKLHRIKNQLQTFLKQL